MTEQAPRRCRSWLFTPASRPERFDKAAEAGADVLILDLEDAVSPADKDQARANALDYLSRQPGPGITYALRINALTTRAGLADLSGLLDSGAEPAFLVLAKTEAAAHLQILDRLLAGAGKRTRLVGLIESAKGLAEVEAIARAGPRLAALMLGAADLAADLAATPTWEPMLGPRFRLVAACTLGGVMALDTPYLDIRDRQGLTEEVTRAIAMGFTAKAAIHPGQVAPINAALTPSASEMEAARRILEVNKAGVGTVNGQMIDEAVARRARRVLAHGDTPAGS